ncbi:hypothetical protein ADICYQ_2915 [Cyclobacterium qasimii M12-11B]|uniref:Uncharacterized protein n=1 Tax=Cyclobacterium qasimii M12-11B TaxID=641524 RepID=S7VD95_9BACT|nr:hypothetical protein ADICYQ_2915 [Cyclobacterium qasimii M12-11B]
MSWGWYENVLAELGIKKGSIALAKLPFTSWIKLNSVHYMFKLFWKSFIC